MLIKVNKFIVYSIVFYFVIAFKIYETFTVMQQKSLEILIIAYCSRRVYNHYGCNIIKSMNSKFDLISYLPLVKRHNRKKINILLY